MAEIPQKDDAVCSGAGEVETRVSAKKLMEELIKNQFRCALSGLKLTPSTCNGDHRVALVNGGKHCMENMQLVHKEINRMKGTLSQDDFIRLCCAVARHSKKVQQDIKRLDVGESWQSQN